LEAKCAIGSEIGAPKLNIPAAAETHPAGAGEESEDQSDASHVCLRSAKHRDSPVVV